MYTIEELIEAADTLGYPKSLVAAALKLSGKTEFTEEEAKQIIEDFANEKV